MQFRLFVLLLAGAVLLGPTAAAISSDPGASESPATALAETLAPALEQAPGLLPGQFLAGYDEGLYRIDAKTRDATALWTGGEVKKILRASGEAGWYFLTSAGLIRSRDLSSFEERSTGLPVKTYKVLENGVKKFEKEVMDLKDLELDRTNPLRLAVCTKDSVFVSSDSGSTWEDFGSPVWTTGLKAILLAPFPGSGEAAVWASHPIKGLFVRKLAKGSAWVGANEGLALMTGTTSVEEIADIALGPATAAGLAYPLSPATGVSASARASTQNGASVPVATRPSAAVDALARQNLWVSNSFLGRVYRMDASGKSFIPVWSDGTDFGTVESLDALPDGSLRFVSQKGVRRLRLGSPAEASAGGAGGAAIGNVGDASDGGADIEAADDFASALVAMAARKADAQLLCVAWTEGGRPSALSELWLAHFVDRKPYRAAAEGRHGLYLQTGYAVNAASRAKYFKVMEERGLDSLVVDMKDDYGRLRFAPHDPLVRRMGKTSSPLDVEAFSAEAKARGIWLVARIPVFKDEVAYRYSKERYAAWDEKAKAPWRGYRTVKIDPPAAPVANAPAPQVYAPSAPPQPGAKPAPSVAQPSAQSAPMAAPPPAPKAPTTERQPFEEYWVDPYCEDIWAYNVAIANEMIARGFDEIQFDYIRFPTDGDNIDDVSFRWRDPGMDKESALASFLRHARNNIAAPISIDIYGANGWYRSGVRTGQDVELLAKYSDVISPMLYPSHFEQGFLADPPAEERPYRIYRLGSLRNEHIARKRVIVRPYVQAFYLNVSYDKKYYDASYVRREVEGVRDSVNLGLTFWNNIGRYDDIPVLEVGPDRRLALPHAAAQGLALDSKPTTANAASAASAAADAIQSGVLD